MEYSDVISLLLGVDKSRYLHLHIKSEYEFTLGNKLYPTDEAEHVGS